MITMCVAEKGWVAVRWERTFDDEMHPIVVAKAYDVVTWVVREPGYFEGTFVDGAGVFMPMNVRGDNSGFLGFAHLANFDRKLWLDRAMVAARKHLVSSDSPVAVQSTEGGEKHR